MSYTAIRAAYIEKAKNFKHYQVIQNLEDSGVLDEEQIAIIAGIVENCGPTVLLSVVALYVDRVVAAQRLMPYGRLRSKQVLATLAVIVGLRPCL